MKRNLWIVSGLSISIVVVLAATVWVFVDRFRQAQETPFSHAMQAAPSDTARASSGPAVATEASSEEKSVPQEAAGEPEKDIKKEVSGSVFRTLSRGAALPAESECASRISPVPEIRPENRAANQAKPSVSQLQSFRSNASVTLILQLVPRITGNFTGTTDEILQWGACKWGFDVDGERAVSVVESDWRQSTLGDFEKKESLCPPDVRQGSKCPTSFGIVQVKYEEDSIPAYPMTKQSTAFNIDYKLGKQYACYTGKIDYLRERKPEKGYPSYPNGNQDQMYWGCIGWHYSGGWYDKDAIGYIQEVKNELRNRTWTQKDF